MGGSVSASVTLQQDRELYQLGSVAPYDATQTLHRHLLVQTPLVLVHIRNNLCPL